MSDVHTKEQRSRNMSAIRAKGNKSTELRLIKLFRMYKFTGWRRHLNLFGTPDFVFTQKNLAIFVDGCFWHGCKTCRLIPKSNKLFWNHKINANIQRDKLVVKTLRKQGWKVLRIKEHQFKYEKRLLKKMQSFLS